LALGLQSSRCLEFLETKDSLLVAYNKGENGPTVARKHPLLVIPSAQRIVVSWSGSQKDPLVSSVSGMAIFEFLSF
jgi:hypothetical protein